MRAISCIFLISLLLALASAEDLQAYQDIAVGVLRKASDANFFKRNAVPISDLIPPIQPDLEKFLTKNTKTLSSISKKLLPKIQIQFQNSIAWRNKQLYCVLHFF